MFSSSNVIMFKAKGLIENSYVENGDPVLDSWNGSTTCCAAKWFPYLRPGSTLKN